MNPQRVSTTVPQQALYMMNSPFVLDRATALVEGPEFASTAVEEPQIQELYERVFARSATPREVAAALNFIKATAEERREVQTPLWQYGRSRYDGASQKVEFLPLPHWTGTAWQGGPKLPDPNLGWAMLDADGGHPTNDLGVAKRFTAPRNMRVSLAGRLHRNARAGNGVLARIVSSHQGQLAEWVVEPERVAGAPISEIELKAGEVLDFIVESRGDENSDSFQWRILLRASDGEMFGSQTQFRGPLQDQRPLTAWQKYAQVLLETNEFAFVD